MIVAKRYRGNPVFTPNEEKDWEAASVFDGSILKEKDKYHLAYRAVSFPQRYFGKDVELSSIGHATSIDGVAFENRKLLIAPEYQWEQFGCENPRIVKLGDRYLVFYTAFSSYPRSFSGVRIGVAMIKNFSEIDKKYQVTHFDSRAMAVFPEKINGRIGAILTVGKDNSSAVTALALFNRKEQIWSKKYWTDWLSSLKNHTIPLRRKKNDFIGAEVAPIKTKDGWLLIYYQVDKSLSSSVIGIQAALLDLKNPLKIIGRTTQPLLVPKEEYERYGKTSDVVFPSSALIEKGVLKIYYGAADTVLCLAQLGIDDLLKEINPSRRKKFINRGFKKATLEKYSQNPILEPLPENSWESENVFNAAAVYEEGRVHFLYRAMGKSCTSVFGYASSIDGFKIEMRLSEPVYIPREIFEKKLKPGNSGCEDPRITKIGDRFYICYTAHDGEDPTQIAISYISVSDFLDKKWRWSKPKIVSCPERNDKNACVMGEKVKGKYVFFHRIGGCIWIDFVSDLSFRKGDWLGGKLLLFPNPKSWDSEKVGIAGPPMKTKKGWLLIYHGLSREDNKYRLGAVLLDLKNPERIVSKLDYPILEPGTRYEKKGLRPDAIFSCGSVIIKKRLFVYYGAADQVTCVASMDLDKLMKAFFQVPS